MLQSMVPIRSELYDYSFDRTAITEIRAKLALSQANLADLLDVPVNTVSRWETGATTPDADTLAAIYSIARQRDLSPEFFMRRSAMDQRVKQRSRLVLAWDFQNLALSVDDIEDEWEYMKDYMALIFPATRARRVLRTYGPQPAFTYLTALGSPTPTIKGTFEALGFQVFEGYFNADSQLVIDSLQDCSVEPHNTIFILVTKDGDYAELLRNLTRMGVDAYVWSKTDEIGERLRDCVEGEHFIPWDKPYVVAECMEVVRELKGKPISKGDFGQQCRERLEEDEVYPSDVGFSRRNPYGSLLTRLESQGVLEVKRVREPDLISIKLRH